MRLDNIFGLLGTILLLQLVDSLNFDILIAAAFLILSDDLNSGALPVRRALLIPKNPLHVLSDRQFKKEFRFTKQDLLVDGAVQVCFSIYSQQTRSHVWEGTYKLLFNCESWSVPAICQIWHVSS